MRWNESGGEHSRPDATVYLLADDPTLLAALGRVSRADERVHESQIPDIWHELRVLKSLRMNYLALRARGRTGTDDFAAPELPERVWVRYEAHWVPAIVFLDLVAEGSSLPRRIREIRSVLPTCLFVLYGTERDIRASGHRLGREWAERLRHYFVLRKPGRRLIFGSALPKERDLRALLDRARPVALAQSRAGGDRGPRLFISYSHRDTTIAEELEYRLHFAGYRVWMDVRSISAGDAWSEVIKAGLEQSELLILAVSAEALRSPYVQREYEYYLERSKPLIPILIDEGMELPESLASIQYIDLTRGDFELNFQRLLDGIAKYVAVPA